MNCEIFFKPELRNKKLRNFRQLSILSCQILVMDHVIIHPAQNFRLFRVGVLLTRDPIINKILSMKRHFIKTTEVTTNPRRSQVMWEKTEKIEIFFANFFQKKIAILVLSIVLSIVLSVTQFYISQFWLKKISQFFVSQFWYLVSFFANFVKYYLCLKLRWNRKARTASR